MILSCPACRARYVVPDSAVGPTGRQVRCASCKHSWFQQPSMPEELVLTPASEGPAPRPEPVLDEPASDEPFVEATPAPPPASEPEPMVEAAAPQPDIYQAFAHEPPFRPRRGRGRILIGLALFVLLLAAAAAGAVAWFGLPTIERFILGKQESPLVIEETRKPERRMMESGNELLVVSGRIMNRTDEVQRVPPQIRAELHDAQGRVVYGWSIAAPVERLAPGQSVTFNSAQVDPPRGARTLRLYLASSF